MGLYKSFVSLLNTPIYILKFKYSSKSISLYLKSTSTCGPVQLPLATTGTISTASTLVGCPDHRLDLKAVSEQTRTGPIPAGKRGDHSRGHDQSRGIHGHTTKFRVLLDTASNPGSPTAAPCTTQDDFYRLFFFKERKQTLLISRVQRDISEPQNELNPLSLC